MAQTDTVDRILHAATILFAERGFAETSLRTITGMADVNLAAVNYHFGTKKALIQAVFVRFLEPYCREINRQLDLIEADLDEGETPSADKLLRCMLETLLTATEEVHEDPQIFMRLLGLAYTQSQEHLRHHIIGKFGNTYSRFVNLLQKTIPGIDPVEYYWRLYFMLGAGVFTLSSHSSIRAILNADYQADTDIRTTIDMMVPPIASMVTAPNVKR